MTDDPKPTTVYVGFSRLTKGSLPQRIFSSLIRLIEGTPYSHVYIRWRSVRGQADVIYQASGLQVNVMAQPLFLDHEMVLDEYAFEVSDETFGKLLHFCLMNVGIPYGFLSAVGLGISRLAKRWFGLTLRNPLAAGTSSQVCSKLVGYIAEEFLGVEVAQSLDDAGPLEVHDAMERAHAVHLRALQARRLRTGA